MSKLVEFISDEVAQRGLTAEEIEARKPSTTWSKIRFERDLLLSETDWMVLPDSPYAASEGVLTYRQALRDITETYASPEEVVWPDKPVV